MSFDYEKMQQDIIDHWKVDMSISRKSDYVKLAKVRHKATLLGFRYDNLDAEAEVKKYHEAVSKLGEAVEALENLHPTVQRAISERLSEKGARIGFGDAVVEIADHEFWMRRTELKLESGRNKPFLNVDMEKVAAVEMTIFYERRFGGANSLLLNYDMDLPQHLNEASLLHEFLEQTFPVFQVEPTNIRGAYNNWRKLMNREEVFKNLPLNEMEEAEAVIVRAQQEQVEAGKQRRKKWREYVKSKEAEK